jgi:hypothetical protein
LVRMNLRRVEQGLLESLGVVHGSARQRRRPGGGCPLLQGRGFRVKPGCMDLHGGPEGVQVER